jgi:hypothetical protein
MKNNLTTNTIMKKTLLFTLSLLPLWGLGGLYSFASAPTVTPITANYTNHTITFSVEWTTVPYNSQIWVIADYRKVEGTAPTGAWTPATVTSATKTAGTGSIATVVGKRGFWLSGTTGTTGSATITATLGSMPALFNWCAYASDYPPNATMNNGTYTLKGTPPFTINDTITESSKNFSGTCITSLTDRTDCPGIINNNFTPGSITTVSYNTLCSTAGTATTVATAPTGGGTYSYQWTVSYNNGAAATISGATATTYIPPATATAGTYRYVRQVKDVLCNTVYTNSTGTVTRTVGSLRDQAVGCGCVAGLTAINGICRDLAADGAKKISGCGAELEAKSDAIPAPKRKRQI